jgi:hypothetical protein
LKILALAYKIHVYHGICDDNTIKCVNSTIENAMFFFWGGPGGVGKKFSKTFKTTKTEEKKKETLNNRVRPWSGLNPSLCSGTNSGY